MVLAVGAVGFGFMRVSHHRRVTAIQNALSTFIGEYSAEMTVTPPESTKQATMEFRGHVSIYRRFTDFRFKADLEEKKTRAKMQGTQSIEFGEGGAVYSDSQPCEVIGAEEFLAGEVKTLDFVRKQNDGDRVLRFEPLGSEQLAVCMLIRKDGKVIGSEFELKLKKVTK